MAQRKAKFTVADFSEGINTDSSPLNFPPSASRDIKNFVIGDDGSLQRRLGLQALVSSDLPSIAGGGSYLDIARSGKVNAAIWKSGTSFAPDYLVVSYGGRVLEFYDMADALEPQRRSEFTTNIEFTQVSPVPVMTVFRNAIMAAQAADYDTVAPGTIVEINLGAGFTTRNVNLRTVYDTVNRQAPASNVVVNFVIPADTTIGSTSVNNPALRTGNWPAGANVTLINRGTVAGRGGRGGNASVNRSNRSVSNGGRGGDAIQLDSNINITNNGLIGAGGGGGGAAGSVVSPSIGLRHGTAASGGGGAGIVGGKAGTWSIKNISGGFFFSSSDVTDGSTGSTGGTEAGGAGGRASSSRATGGTLRSRGGKGGDLGFKGQDAPTDYSSSGSVSRSDGGDPGIGVSGYSKIVANNFNINPPVGDNEFRFQL